MPSVPFRNGDIRVGALSLEQRVGGDVRVPLDASGPSVEAVSGIADRNRKVAGAPRVRDSLGLEQRT